MPEIVAFVHAKGTSERVPGKNFRTLGDRPLFCHAIANARASRYVDCVVIDSDDRQILQTGELHGAVALRRPNELATNQTTGDELAYWQASNYPESRIMLQVIPTSPFLRAASIDRAIEMISELGVDSVAGVFSEVLYQWNDGRPVYFRDDGTIPNSSDMDPVVFETTGLYVNRTDFVLRERRRLNVKSCAPIRLSRIEAIDINTQEDFDFASVFLQGLHARALAAGPGVECSHTR
jgi:CMP-N-acetylneuraminic acid synthetase